MHHINPKTKEVGICRSEKGQCPFDDGGSHFETPKDAYLEAERRLVLEYGDNPSLKPAKMVETFEEFQARRWGPPRPSELPIPPYHNDSSAYLAMFSPADSQLADYCRESRLTLEETAAVADLLKARKGAVTGGPSALVTAALQGRIADARKNTATIDAQLAASKYFGNGRLRRINGKITIETNQTVGGSDLITRMNEDGKISFGLYDHEDGTTYNSYNPADFVDENQQPLSEWATHYNSYREHLYSRVLWEKEARSREERAGAIRFP